MRILTIMPLIVIASCSAGDGESEKKPTRAAALEAGQWEITREITGFKAADAAARPAIKGAVGEKATSSVCIAKGETSKPPAPLLVGDADKCTYKSNYFRNGRMNATFGCSRPGLQGSVQMAADGTFKADSFDAVVNTKTFLSTDGDVEIVTKLSGKRTGECTPAKAA